MRLLLRSPVHFLLRLLLRLSLFPLFFWSGPLWAKKSSPPRTVFVQLFEWPWDDVAKECETYLGPHGFSAVQVSPPQEHLQWSGNPWWERYQAVSYKLESRSGNESEFVDMIQRCQKSGVDIYADVLMNHMAGMGEGFGFAGTPFTHFQYDGLYSYDDFHHCGRNGNDHIVNFFDLYELQNCMLVNLADLKTESKKVQKTLANYINHLVDLGVKGLRIDAAKHIPAVDIRQTLNLVSKKVYSFQELIINSGEPLNVYDYLVNGDVTAYGYPFRVGAAFHQLQLSELWKVSQFFPASEDAIVFLENHDLQRAVDGSSLTGYLRDPNLFRLAQVFMLTWPYGYPQVFSGFEFSDYDQGPPVDLDLRVKPVLDDKGRCQAPWTCEHRLPEVAALVQFRNLTDKEFYISQWWSLAPDQIAYVRGQSGFVVINAGKNTLKKKFTLPFPMGTYKNLLEPGTVYRVDGQGQLNLTLSPQKALVLHKDLL